LKSKIKSLTKRWNEYYTHETKGSTFISNGTRNQNNVLNYCKLFFTIHAKIPQTTHFDTPLQKWES